MSTFHNTTHRALLTDEIYLNMIRSLDDRSLARLARTCRGLSEPALNVLWESLESLLPLISILPRDSVRRKVDRSDPKRKQCHPRQPFDHESGYTHAAVFGHHSVQRKPNLWGSTTPHMDQRKLRARAKVELLLLPAVYELKRSPTNAEWDRITSYTDRVKHLRHAPPGTEHTSGLFRHGLDRISPAVLMAFVSPPAGRPLFAKLESVRWDGSDPDTFLFLWALRKSPLLSLDISGVPCGDRVNIRTRRDVLKVLIELGDFSPSLQSLRIRLGKDFPFSFRSMAKAICSMRNLVSVEYDLYELDALRHIAYVPTLWRVKIHMHMGTTHFPRDGLQGSTFPNLQTLVLHGGHQEVSELFRYIKGPSSVRDLSITTPFSDYPSSLSTMLKAIATHCDLHALESLHLRETVPSKLCISECPEFNISDNTLKEALRLKGLRHFILDTDRAVSLCDDSLRNISASWKKLETLEINLSSGRWYANASSGLKRATIRGLFLLLEGLPCLSRLAIAINGKTITRRYRTPPAQRFLLRRLNLLDSKLGDNVDDVVICLAGMVDMPESWYAERARLRVGRLRLTEPQLGSVLQGRGKKWRSIRDIMVGHYNSTI